MCHYFISVKYSNLICFKLSKKNCLDKLLLVVNESGVHTPSVTRLGGINSI